MPLHMAVHAPSAERSYVLLALTVMTFPSTTTVQDSSSNFAHGSHPSKETWSRIASPSSSSNMQATPSLITIDSPPHPTANSIATVQAK